MAWLGFGAKGRMVSHADEHVRSAAQGLDRQGLSGSFKPFESFLERHDAPTREVFTTHVLGLQRDGVPTAHMESFIAAAHQLKPVTNAPGAPAHAHDAQ